MKLKSGVRREHEDGDCDGELVTMEPVKVCILSF